MPLVKSFHFKYAIVKGLFIELRYGLAFSIMISELVYFTCHNTSEQRIKLVEQSSSKNFRLKLCTYLILLLF